MNKYEAIKKVGKYLGEDRFFEHMSGGYALSGHATPAEVIQLIYGGSVEAIRLELADIQDKTFKKLQKEQS